MQIEKNQGKINFRIVRANFRRIYIYWYLHVLFNFKHFARIYIYGCGIFFFHFFLSLVFFSLPVYFLFENGLILCLAL